MDRSNRYIKQIRLGQIRLGKTQIRLDQVRQIDRGTDRQTDRYIRQIDQVHRSDRQIKQIDEIERFNRQNE